MSDLKERLRHEPLPHERINGLGPAAMEAWHKTCLEAADEIERLKEHSLNLANELCEAELEIERMNRMLDLIYETANHHSLDCQWCALVADDIKQYLLDRSKEQSTTTTGRISDDRS